MYVPSLCSLQISEQLYKHCFSLQYEVIIFVPSFCYWFGIVPQVMECGSHVATLTSIQIMAKSNLVVIWLKLHCHSHWYGMALKRLVEYLLLVIISEPSNSSQIPSIPSALMWLIIVTLISTSCRQVVDTKCDCFAIEKTKLKSYVFQIN